MNRSQDTYLRTGPRGKYRVGGERGNWWVESTDSNGVWIDADSERYRTKAEAEAAALELRRMRAERGQS